ncbi:MAG: hypothetical protein GXY03_13885 [Solirubrobacterales bacterium]|nr:hypothetical protein [Solirubrobacterales bacterium]
MSEQELLLAVGRATAAAADPTLEQFQSGARWATFRWIAAFLPGAPPRFSPLAARVRNHHRQAFTEALGLGAGLLVAERLVAGGTRVVPYGAGSSGAPSIIDIDTKADGAGLRADLEIVPPLGAPGPRVILECKGTSQARGAVVGQLRKGVDQVLAETGPARRIVVGARAPKSASEVAVYAVEVPQPPGPGQAPGTAPGSGPPPASPPPPVSPRPPGPSGPPLGDVERRAWLEGQRILRYAGLREQDVDAVSGSSRHAGVELVGSTARIATVDGWRDVTVGIVGDVARRLFAGGPWEARVGSGREAAAEAWQSRGGEVGVAREGPDAGVLTVEDAGETVSVAADGCALAVAPVSD